MEFSLNNFIGSTPKHVKMATLHIEGMTCDGCSNTVRRVIESNDKLYEVQVDHDQHIAKLKFKPSEWSKDQLAQLLDDIHYNITSVEVGTVDY